MQLENQPGDPGTGGGRPGSALQHRGLLLAALTITWNVIEAVVAISAGIASGSIALVGFGFDSTIEVLSAFVVVWQFRGGYAAATTKRANAPRCG